MVFYGGIEVISNKTTDGVRDNQIASGITENDARHVR
jgi:hypothetical protein